MCVFLNYRHGINSAEREGLGRGDGNGTSYLITDLIAKKRDGEELSAGEIGWFIHQMLTNGMDDSQIGRKHRLACLQPQIVLP